MKTQLLVLCTLLFSSGFYAQEVISSQGESYSNSSGSIDFTVGEPVTFTGTDGSNSITQGFHQTNWSVVDIIHHSPDFEASIYPNPTSELMHIKTSDFNNVHYTLYDSKGKLVIQNELAGALSAIQIAKLAPGKYSLTLYRQKELLKTFKLIKTQ